MSKFKLKISARLLKKKIRKQSYLAPKHCRFCGHKDQLDALDYKNTDLLRGFLTERGKILPSRVSGNCFRHQRELAKQIKVARSMALLPYCSVHI
jgi:small subunit ribosomal protein S18